MMSRRFGRDLTESHERLSKIFMVKINKQFYRSRITSATDEWLKKHEIKLEE